MFDLVDRIDTQTLNEAVDMITVVGKTDTTGPAHPSTTTQRDPKAATHSIPQPHTSTPQVKFSAVSSPDYESEIADAIREVFTAWPETAPVGPNVANALYEVARAIDRLAAAVKSTGS
jgi:hypothetical protein